MQGLKYYVLSYWSSQTQQTKHFQIMKLFQNTSDFEYPWDQVSAANWNKYPNEVSTHVIAVDVLRRELQDDGNRLVTERLITVRQGVPRWIMLMVGGDNTSYVREVSTVNLLKKELVLKSCNLTMRNILTVFETVRYSPHPDFPQEKTLFEQSARITAGGSLSFGRICSKMEEWSVDRFCENAKKGKIGFESVLKEFHERYVNDLSSSIVSKVNETVEDVKLTAGSLFKETEKKCSILSDYYDLFMDAFRDETHGHSSSS